MPKHRPPHEVWQKNLRLWVWLKADKRCKRCGVGLTWKQVHVDHIQSGKLGTNKFSNLRALCRRCHVLRADLRHQGMIAAALRDGIIPPNWRELVWDG